MYRFLMSRRWLGLGVFVVVMVVACWFLANWQFDRWEARKADNARAVAHMAEAPVALDALVDSSGAIAEDHEWTNVELTGHFRTSTSIVVRYVRVNSRPGVQVVTPMDLSDGRVVLVNRGWMETADPHPAPDTLPAPPSGEQTIVGWWHPDNNAGAEATRPVDGSVRAIDSRQWTAVLDTTAVPGWVSLQEPVQEGLTAEPPPDLGEGPHLFYAIQWVVFAAMALFGGFWFVRAEVRDRRRAAEVSATQANDTRSA